MKNKWGYISCALCWIALSTAICIAIWILKSPWPLLAFVFGPWISDDDKNEND